MSARLVPKRVKFRLYDEESKYGTDSLIEIEWDVSENETHTSSSVVTDHPIEAGADVTDHVVDKADTIVLKLRQTNDPIMVPYSEGFAGMSLLRAEDTYNLLLDLRAERTPFDVLTSLRIYGNCLIESIVTERNASLGRVVSLTVSLKQVKTVSAISIADPRDPRAKTGKTEGLKPTPVVTSKVAEEKTYTIINSFYGDDLSKRLGNTLDAPK
jgi:hypothetical protein